MQGSDKYNLLKPDKKALWWKNSIEIMENELGKEKSSIGKHYKCFCGQVKQSKEKFKNDTNC